MLIPIPELLLLQKVKAHRDRSWDLRHTASNPIDIAYLRSKIWKDEHDIRNLSRVVTDWDRAWRIAQEYGCLGLVEDTLHGLAVQPTE